MALRVFGMGITPNVTVFDNTKPVVVQTHNLSLGTARE